MRCPAFRPWLLFFAASAACAADDAPESSADDGQAPASGTTSVDSTTPSDDGGGDEPVGGAETRGDAESSGDDETSDDSSDDTNDDDGGSTGGIDACAGPGGGSTRHAAHPMLDGLADNEAIDLGAYECQSRMPQIADHCQKITDFSRFNYDPASHRILMFGGGHAATGRTDVDVFDFEALDWQSLYPSMACEEVAAEAIDPRGFHESSGHPVARHTYDQSVVATIDGAPHLLLLSTEGFAGHCHSYNATIESVASLRLDAECPWEYSPQFELPWAYATSAEFDPVSGMVIVLGDTRGAGEGGLWVYDPKTATVVSYVDEVEYGGIANNMVYYPPTDRMIYLQRDGVVREVVLDRDDWSGTVSNVLNPTGMPAQGNETGFAYDSCKQVIGGGVADGMFFTFDPIANAWSSEAMSVTSSDGHDIGTQVFHMMEYDPVDNAYVFIADGSGGRRTWAYRHRSQP